MKDKHGENVQRSTLNVQHPKSKGQRRRIGDPCVKQLGACFH
jgi:hypothetical protein